MTWLDDPLHEGRRPDAICVINDVALYRWFDGDRLFTQTVSIKIERRHDHKPQFWGEINAETSKNEERLPGKGSRKIWSQPSRDVAKNINKVYRVHRRLSSQIEAARRKTV
jgi:hypothetical protein